jgi:hypothetical protein
VLFVPRTLAEPAPDGEPLSLAEHYARVGWVGADLDDEVNHRRVLSLASSRGPVS